MCRREALRNLPVSQLHRLQQNKLFSQHFMRKDSPGGLNLKFARESWNDKILMWRAFSLVGETGAPGESLASTERTCNLHTWSCNVTSCCEEKVLATEPLLLFCGHVSVKRVFVLSTLTAWCRDQGSVSCCYVSEQNLETILSFSSGQSLGNASICIYCHTFLAAKLYCLINSI